MECVGYDLGPNRPGEGFFLHTSSRPYSRVLLGKIQNMRSSGVAVPGLVVVVVSFFDEVNRPMVVVQPMMSLGEVASGENRASMSVVADDDGVFECRFLHEGIVYVALVIRLRLLMHVKCIHDLCTLPLDIPPYLHHILVIFMLFYDNWE
jgi:hypothetical protein